MTLQNNEYRNKYKGNVCITFSSRRMFKIKYEGVHPRVCLVEVHNAVMR